MALLVGSGTSLGGLTGGAAVARLLVVVSGNTSGLYTSLNAATKGMEGFKQNAGALGSALTRTLTLPILALGGYAIKAASDFQSSMARIAGLTPIVEDSGRSIESLGQDIIEMSVRTGTAATELANALYFAGSAGLDANTALQVVELSAKGAAIGMGEAADISKVLIFALNNYQDSGLSAAEAMDTLTVAIREGTAEPNELAISLGRVIPVAKEAGISFSTLVGSISALTNIGVPTRVATTSLRALFSQLLAPTIQATELLDNLGITAEELRDAVEAGPVVAFDLLFEATGNNIDALHDIIPQIRAFTAFLGLTGDRADEVQRIFQRTANATGAFEKAFKEIAKTPAFKFQVSLQKLNAAAIDLGNKAMPIFLKLTDVLGAFGDMLRRLPRWMQYTILGLAGLLAAAGPALKIFDALTNAGQGMFTSFRSGITALAAFGFSVGLVAANLDSMENSGVNLLNTLGVLVGSFGAAKIALNGLNALAMSGVLGFGRLAGVFSALGGGLGTAVAVGIGVIVTAIGFAISAAGRLDREMRQLGDSALDAANKGQSVRQWLQDIESESSRAALRDIAKDMGLLGQSVSNALPQLLAGGGGAIEQFIAHLRGLRDQLRGAFQTEEAQGLEKFISLFEKAAEAGIPLSKALRDQNLDWQDLFDTIEEGGSAATAIGTDFSQAADNADEAGQRVQELEQAWRDHNTAIKDTIALQSANEVAVESLARKWGVSTDTIQEALNKYTGGVAIMDEKAQEALGHAAGFVDESGNIVGRAFEMQKQAAEAAQEVATTLRDSFDIFGELPEKFDQAMDKVLNRAEELSDIATQQALDTRTLFRRGVPAGLVESILGKGPEAARRFANASDKELRRLITSYQVALGATDAAILQETVHQERKGQSMVERFTTAILSRRTLPQAAAQQIVELMTDAFARGDVDTAGLRTMQSFANAIATSGLPPKAAGRVALAVARRLSSGNKIPEAGTAAGRAFAEKLASTAGISRRSAEEIMNRVGSGIDSKKPGVTAKANEAAHDIGNAIKSPEAQTAAYNAGFALMREFASGIIAGLFAPLTATENAVNSVRNKLDNELHSSPKYFTYYTGKELMKQLGEGMASMPSSYPHRQLSRVLHHPTGRIQAASRAPRRIDMDLDVRIDRRRHARNVDYELVSRGL